MIMIPARVMRAASIFTGSDQGHMVLQQVNVLWDGGDWEVQATDSYRALLVRSGQRLKEPACRLLVNPDALRLKASDEWVRLEDEEGDPIRISDRKGGIRSVTQEVVDGTFPKRFHDLFGDPGTATQGHTGAFSSEYLKGFCDAAKMLIKDKKLRSMQLMSVPREGADPNLAPAYVCFPQSDERYQIEGLLMPIRL